MLSRLFYTGPSLPTLHEEYAKHSRIDEAAQRTSESSVLIEAPVPQVWALLSDVARWPSWYPQMTVLSIGAVRPDAPLHWKLGRVAIRSTFAVVNPPHELLLYRESTLQAGHQEWLAALKTAAGQAALPHPASAANVDANRRDNSGN
jgi:Polyketide cyclase / dehydrase and lipid transport